MILDIHRFSILLLFNTVVCFRTGIIGNISSRKFSLLMQKSDRKDIWRTISSCEKDATELLANGDSASLEKAISLFAQSQQLKELDPFIRLLSLYSKSVEQGKTEESKRLMQAMIEAGVPPHIDSIVKKLSGTLDANVGEIIDPNSIFSDTVTDKIRVKASSFYDAERSDPVAGKFMFWYKVSITNEGPEPVQIVGRMWDIEKCNGETETVRGQGIMSIQPIIGAGDVFSYSSACPLIVSAPANKRVLGNMSGAYTLCRGSMGQHNFSVKIGKFNLMLPELIEEEEEPANVKALPLK